MKKLFFLLLLCNLFLFGWLYMSESRLEDAGEIEPLASEVEELKLLDELPVEEVMSQSRGVGVELAPSEKVELEDNGVAAVEPLPLPTLCFTIGPFIKDELVDRAKQMIAAQKIDAQRRKEFVEERFGYWVLLPAYPSRAKAVAATKRLAEMGVKDYFVVLASGKRNAVSLGVFREKKSADRRKVAIGALGFNPVIEDRMQRKTQYWLDYRGTSPLSDELWSEIKGLDSEIKQLDQACR